MNCDPSISICICTYRRPYWLRQTLESLRSNTQSLDLTEVIVVDNDPEGTAADVVKDFMFGSNTRLYYHNETTKNISVARNRTIKEAKGKWLAMIDDDEFASENWLANLLRSAERYNADVIFGPVLPLFEEGTPAWIINGKFFDRRRHPTGTRVDWHDARTGNALIKSSLLACIPGPFLESFGSTGGEDSALFRRIQAKQAHMIWCDEAIVYEHVPPERATRKWLLARSFRTGQIWARVELDSTDGMRVSKAMHIAFLSGIRIAATIPMILLAAPVSLPKSFSYLRTLANRIGKLTALFGHQHSGY